MGEEYRVRQGCWVKIFHLSLTPALHTSSIHKADLWGLHQWAPALQLPGGVSKWRTPAGYQRGRRAWGIYSPISFPPNPLVGWVSPSFRDGLEACKSSRPRVHTLQGSGLCSLFLPLEPMGVNCLPVISPRELFNTLPFPYSLPLPHLSKYSVYKFFLSYPTLECLLFPARTWTCRDSIPNSNKNEREREQKLMGPIQACLDGKTNSSQIKKFKTIPIKIPVVFREEW